MNNSIKRMYDYAKKLEKEARKWETANTSMIKGIKRLLPEIAAKEYKKIADGVIKEFYEDYEPEYYIDRDYTLYNAFKIKYGNGWVDWKLTAGGLDGEHHRASRELIFDYMIERGWHGGSPYIKPKNEASGGKHPNPGEPYYRTPYNIWSKWGRPAEVWDKSPKEEIEKRIRERSALGWDEEQHKIAIEAFKGVI